MSKIIVSGLIAGMILLTPTKAYGEKTESLESAHLYEAKLLPESDPDRITSSSLENQIILDLGTDKLKVLKDTPEFESLDTQRLDMCSVYHMLAKYK